jgi:hypothetical protein
MLDSGSDRVKLDAVTGEVRLPDAPHDSPKRDPNRNVAPDNPIILDPLDFVQHRRRQRIQEIPRNLRLIEQQPAAQVRRRVRIAELRHLATVQLPIRNKAPHVAVELLNVDFVPVRARQLARTNEQARVAILLKVAHIQVRIPKRISGELDP